jgi:hypothetical protein
MGWTAEEALFSSRQAQATILFSIPSVQTPSPTVPPRQLVPKVLSPGLKRQKREDDSTSYSRGHQLCSHSILVRFEVFVAMTMKNAVFWDVTSCGSCKNRHFGGTYRLHHQGTRCGELVIAFLRSVPRLLITANVSSLPILVTLMMEAIRSTETSVLARATRRSIPEDTILHSIVT